MTSSLTLAVGRSMRAMARPTALTLHFSWKTSRCSHSPSGEWRQMRRGLWQKGRIRALMQTQSCLKGKGLSVRRNNTTRQHHRLQTKTPRRARSRWIIVQRELIIMYRLGYSVVVDHHQVSSYINSHRAWRKFQKHIWSRRKWWRRSVLKWNRLIAACVRSSTCKRPSQVGRHQCRAALGRKTGSS